MSAKEIAAEGTTAPASNAAPAVSVDRLLDDAWTVDCAVRLRQPAWAAASAQTLLTDLARYGQQIRERWSPVDPGIAESLATDVFAAQVASLAIADELRSGTGWPQADLYDHVARLIHQEAVAVGESAWAVD